MAMTPYSQSPLVISILGTTPQERGLETQQFKAKFDEGLKEFTEWFNDTHKTEFDTHLADDANPNLLINGDFKVWQRGTLFDGWYGEIYTVDRYSMADTVGNGVKVEYDTNGMKITGKATCSLVITYKFEDADFNKLNGKTITQSYSLDGVITKSTFILSSNSVQLIIDIGLSETKILNWWKVELGSSDTPFTPRPFVQELAMCQRYYEKSYDYSSTPGTSTLNGISTGVALDGGIIAPNIYYRVRKRVDPTVLIYSAAGTLGQVSAVNSQTDFGATGFVVMNGGDLQVTRISKAAGTSLVAGSEYWLAWTADAEL